MTNGRRASSITLGGAAQLPNNDGTFSLLFSLSLSVLSRFKLFDLHLESLSYSIRDGLLFSFYSSSAGLSLSLFRGRTLNFECYTFIPFYRALYIGLLCSPLPPSFALLFLIHIYLSILFYIFVYAFLLLLLLFALFFIIPFAFFPVPFFFPFHHAFRCSPI